MHDHPPASPSLDPIEQERLHRQDRFAAGVVAGLMTVIFLFGLVLYAVIAWQVAS